MGDVTFSIEGREATGKGVARKLRQRGLAPGVVYGGGREACSVAFDSARLERLLATSHGGVNTLIDLEGDSPAAGRTVIAKELQREPVRGAIIHADFYEVDLAQKIEVQVPIHLDGTPEGVVQGGVLDQQLREVMLLCLPGAIPDDLRIDVSAMVLGDSLHVSDLTVPAGIELHADEALTIATVLVPRVLRDSEIEGEGEGEGEGEATEEAAAEGAASESGGDEKAKGDEG